MKCQSCHHTETSQLICSANRLTGFCMMATLVFNDLRPCQASFMEFSFHNAVNELFT